MQNILFLYFSGFGKVFLKNLCYVTLGMMRSGSASVWSIARALSHETNQTFKANEKRVNRYLQNEDFQINDELWRRYIKLLFNAMIERNLLKTKDNLLIRVDYTTDTDEFLILMASVDFGGRSVPLYFSMRSYPKRKGQSDQKALERAFLKELRHLLSKKYSYTIVADRGFGNDRFAQLCHENGFDFVLRICENLNLKIGDKCLNLKSLSGETKKFRAYVFSWDKEVNFEVKTENNSTWFLFYSDKEFSASAIYQKRFSIEKCFQDQKSSGFNIEKTKIRKYDRFKRLYFTMCLAQLFLVMIGEYVENKKHPLKKRFPILLSAISAYSSLDGTSAKSSLKPQLG